MLMHPATVIIIAWILIAIFVVFNIFTRKGRNSSIKLLYGGRVVKDLGDIGTNRILFGTQKVRLLQCQDKSSTFYVLETRTTAALSIRYNFTKVDDGMLRNFMQLIKLP